jgi:2-enoate reductase
VIGGGDVGCETALLLSRKGNDITIVEMLDELMKTEEIKHNTMVLGQMLEDDGVVFCLNSIVTEITGAGVKVKDQTGTGKELQADMVVLAAGYTSQPERIEALMSACKESYAIGDCAAPGRIRQAVSEGFRIGSLI